MESTLQTNGEPNTPPIHMLAGISCHFSLLSCIYFDLQFFYSVQFKPYSELNRLIDNCLSEHKYLREYKHVCYYFSEFFIEFYRNGCAAICVNRTGIQTPSN